LNRVGLRELGREDIHFLDEDKQRFGMIFAPEAEGRQKLRKGMSKLQSPAGAS
jgi:hypothetical protein